MQKVGDELCVGIGRGHAFDFHHRGHEHQLATVGNALHFEKRVGLLWRSGNNRSSTTLAATSHKGGGKNLDSKLKVKGKQENGKKAKEDGTSKKAKGRKEPDTLFEDPTFQPLRERL